jgi:hypothetical protein
MTGHKHDSWLSRQQRRHIDRQLPKLVRHGVCSFCGSPFRPGSSKAAGFDAHGKDVLAGECCVNQIDKIFGLGLELTIKQSAAASLNAAVNKMLNDAERHGGFGRPLEVNLVNSPWKVDDRDWFERNPKRSHRARAPFPSELDEEAAKVPTGKALLMLVRELEPGSRLRPDLCLDADLLPLPDDEAVAHALFEVAIGREAMPGDRQALRVLAEKYTVQSGGNDDA